MSNYAEILKRKPPPSQPSRSTSDPKHEGGAKESKDVDFPPLSSASAEKSSLNRGDVAVRKRPAASKRPVEVLKRPKEESSHAQQDTNNKKSKKPKPTLQHMSLAYVIPKGIVPSAPTATKPPPTKAAPPSAETPKVTSEQEFPSLGAAALAPKPSKPSLPAHASWGKMKKQAVKPPPKKQAQHLQGKSKAASKQQSSSKPAAASLKKKPDAAAPAIDWKSFGAKPRNEGGEEHELIRLLQDGKFQSSQQKKGRQRITPRKKKFTTLKKKVLQERLEAWRKLHPKESRTQTEETQQSSDITTAGGKTTCTVCLHNFAESEELEDEDEYQEIEENLKDMATRVDAIRDAFLLKQPNGCPAFVWFKTPQSAAAACACWKGFVLSGQSLQPDLLYPECDAATDESVTNEVWRQAVVSAYSAEKNTATDSSTPTAAPASIVLRNILTKEDFEDEECLEESLVDIRSLVAQHGSVVGVETKQDDTGGSVTVTYGGGASVATNAVAKLNGLVVGGMTVSASLVDETNDLNNTFVVQLKNALTNDDFEDEECLQESLTDIESMSKQHGSVSGVRASKEDGGIVFVTFVGDECAARSIVEKLNGTVLGGNIVSASVLGSGSEELSSTNNDCCLLLHNILTEDDIADEECLQESIADVKELARRYGTVSNVAYDVNDSSGAVKLEYEGGEQVTRSAAEKFNGMVIGGRAVVARALFRGGDEGEMKKQAPTSVPAEALPKPDLAPQKPSPMYSGDKLISERFAECKRAPKLATSHGPRNYAILLGDEVRTLLKEMLAELMRLQRRAIEDKNAKARRRLVMGLREVARGIRAHKVKMVVMANNVDQYGAIDEKLQEILDLAREEDIPVVFELNKRHLGKAVGKSIKVSVVGIQSAEGAYQQFKKLTALAASKNQR